MASTQHLLVTANPDGTALVQFNRPEKRNAFSQDMIGQVVRTLAALDRDESVRAVVLTGSPQGPFCGPSARSRPLATAIVVSWPASPLIVS